MVQTFFGGSTVLIILVLKRFKRMLLLALKDVLISNNIISIKWVLLSVITLLMLKRILLLVKRM